MDKLILQSKFIDNTPDESQKFFDEINGINKDDADETFILGVMDALGKQIPKYFPQRQTNDSYMLLRGMVLIKEMINDNLTEKIQLKLIALIKLTLQSGWTATNCDLLEIMITLFSTDYFQNPKKQQWMEHLSIFDSLDLTISSNDIPDNHEYIRRAQQTFCLTMFSNYIKEEVVDQNKEAFIKFHKSLYFKSWCTDEEEAKIYSTVAYRSTNSLKNIYSTSVESFADIFSGLSKKLVAENIQTTNGKDMICGFFSNTYAILRKSKENIELLMDKWAKAIFDFYKLKQKWMRPILKTLCREIRYVDKKVLPVAFKKCEHLVGDAVEYLQNLIADFPKQSEISESEDYSKLLSDWTDEVKAIGTVFLQYTLKTPEQLQSMVPCLVKLISLNTSESVKIFTECFTNIDKPMQELFKNQPELLIPLIDQSAANAFAAGEIEDNSIPYPFSIPTFQYSDLYERISKFGKLSKAFNSPKVQECLRQHFVNGFNQFSMTITCFFSGYESYLVFKNFTPEQMVEFIQSFNRMLDNPLFLIYNPILFKIGDLIGHLTEHLIQSGAKYSSAFKELVATCRLSLKGGLLWEDYNGEMGFNPNSLILLMIFQNIFMAKSKVECLCEFYSLSMDTIDASDESHTYYSSWIATIIAVPRQCPTPEILVDCIPKMISLIGRLNNTDLQGYIYILLDGIQIITVAKVSAVLAYLDKIEALIPLIEINTNLIPIIQIFTAVYGEYPEKISQFVIDNLKVKMKEDIGSSYNIANLFLTISKTHSHLIKPLLEILVETMEKFHLTVAHPIVSIFTNILENDLKSGEMIFQVFVSLINKNKEEELLCVMLFTGLRALGRLRHDLLVNLKSDVEQWQQLRTAYYDICQHLLDVIADRSLAQIDSDVTNQKKKIETIDVQLIDQKEKVDNINKEVKQQKEDIIEVNKRVDDTIVRVDGMETEIGEIVEQVQEIDLKTVSNAPKWAREVSKLMNPESNEDWKLLGSRLGYSTDDIRAWSTHPDPCMSLLSDWFAVRRKVEATKAVLEQLMEMNRTDAAEIVEKALTVAESMISDDDPIEFITPPLIFLSYQWAVQEEVKVLRDHLQKAGYRCWMDIGQMGGGDKLYEAIDRGIRGAYVFVSCVTKKYSESPNCKRELNLAISLQKSVIPLQMERMEWPPIGTMGPLLTEYVFIRMFGKPGAVPVSGTFWPRDRFQELLMQIRYSCAPEYETVDNSYSNWWMPPESKSQYQLKDNKLIPEIDTKTPEIVTVSSKSPQIFISYQWGKQEEIKKLFDFLTSLGYSCWMDIYQMGGGDSLYDKIDRGIRGCSLVVSCVTPKYAESANCRREISLCDSIKKPIIPIMLERMAWPPSGPMSMVFTQLLYISFVDTPEEQQTWNGKATAELVNKIREIIPTNGMNDEIKESVSSNSSTAPSLVTKTDKNIKNDKINDTGPKTSVTVPLRNMASRPSVQNVKVKETYVKISQTTPPRKIETKTNSKNDKIKSNSVKSPVTSPDSGKDKKTNKPAVFIKSVESSNSKKLIYPSKTCDTM